MIRAVSYAALFSAAVAAQGFAQNTVTPLQRDKWRRRQSRQQRNTGLDRDDWGKSELGNSGSADIIDHDGHHGDGINLQRRSSELGIWRRDQQYPVKRVPLDPGNILVLGALGWVVGERNWHSIEQHPSMAAVPAVRGFRNGGLRYRNEPLLRPVKAEGATAPRFGARPRLLPSRPGRGSLRSRSRPIADPRRSAR